MKDLILKAKLVKEYEDNKQSYSTTHLSSNAKLWLDKIIKEYIKENGKIIRK